MSRDLFRVEKGLAVQDENATAEIHILSGNGAPPGTTGKSADAPIGSVWKDQAAGGVQYFKFAHPPQNLLVWRPREDFPAFHLTSMMSHMFLCAQAYYIDFIFVAEIRK